MGETEPRLWDARLIGSQALVDAIDTLKMHYRPPAFERREIRAMCRALAAKAPKRAPRRAG